MDLSTLTVAETFYRERGVPVAFRAAAMNAKAMRIPLRVTDDIEPSPTVLVRVNHGRWLVDCPWCNGAQVASITDRRFVCADCFNAPVQGHPLRTAWPSDELRAEIEAEMQLRSDPARNWMPGETMDDLITERIAAEQEAPAAKTNADLLARIEALEALLARR